MREHRFGRQIGNEEGATLLFVALLLVAILAVSSIAVDVGLWLNTRSEAQRTADAAALAGASVYQEPGPTAAAAENRAREYAGKNYVGHDAVNAAADATDPDVDVVVESANQLVRVTVRGQTASLFARFLGFSSLPVVAQAAARVYDASAAKCVRPFGVADLWEGAKVNQSIAYTGQRYEQFDAAAPSNTATGYGSTASGGYGVTSNLTINSPKDAPVSSIALPIDMNLDASIAKKCGDPSTGAPIDDNAGPGGVDQYKSNMCNCNNSNFKLGVPVPAFTSSTGKQGLVKQGMGYLVDQDANASWQNGTVVGSKYANWLDSPRVVKMALFDPAQLLDLQSGNKNSITFNNIALFWLDGVSSGNLEKITGRFLGFPGEGSLTGGSTSGPNIKVLQLVE